VGPAAASAAVPTPGRRDHVDVADIFRTHGEAFRRVHRLNRAQRRAMRAIALCRTAALGGHRDVCDHCGAERLSYNSCRNRHCPKCQSLATARWLDARRAELLPVEYFHVVFTLPHALYALLDRNARLLYTLLFRTAAATLRAFAHDPRHLGGELGVTAVLHTWGQTLTQHIHLHCIVTGGALAPDGSRWIPAAPGFLFPVRALAMVFRAKYLEALDHAASSGKLTLPDPLAQPGAFPAWLAALCQHDWVVYAKPPFAGPEQVLQYLGRYTHRVALSNDRLIDLQAGVVRFRWKDYSDGHRVKIMALPADEFIRRFLLHIVPEHFVRIRHFGFLANRSRQAKLERCRQLLGQPLPPPSPPAESVPALLLRLTGIDIERCQVCGQGRLAAVEMLRPTLRAPDTS
jgi:putative transposase/transposase-like zinc-binding protein